MRDIRNWLRGLRWTLKAFPRIAHRLGWLESAVIEHNGRFDRLEAAYAHAAQGLEQLEAAYAHAAQRLGQLEASENAMREELAKLAPLQRLLHGTPLPFAWMASSPDWIERADRRVGRAAATLTPAEREEAFYSYYSEMGGDHGPILQQQYQAYLPLLQKAASGGGRVLDIGCGAGEFLSFLRGEQLPAVGVDLSASEVQRAAAAGLSAVCANAGDFLSHTQEHFAGITMFQVIEHLAPEDVLPTLEACANRLAPGGVLMVETINMRHPMAVNGFYTDPTHRKPLSDNYLSFLLQWLGLRDVGVLYTLPEPLPGVSKDEPQRLYANYTVFGFAPGAA